MSGSLVDPSKLFNKRKFRKYLKLLCVALAILPSVHVYNYGTHEFLLELSNCIKELSAPYFSIWYVEVSNSNRELDVLELNGKLKYLESSPYNQRSLLIIRVHSISISELPI